MSTPATRTTAVVPVLGLPAGSQITAVPYEQLPDALRAELTARVDRLGYLGGFFSLAAHQAEPLLHFTRFTEAVKAALPEPISDLVALAAAADAGNDYELVQHIRLARTHGHPDAWIRAAAYGEVPGTPTEDQLAPGERDVRALAAAALGGATTDAELRAAIASLGDTATVGVLLLLGRYAAHSVMSRVLHLRPPVPLDPPLGAVPPAPPTASRNGGQPT